MRKTFEISVLMIFLSIVIIVYSVIRCNNKELKDPLSTYPFGGQGTMMADVLDGWSLSHFIMFTLFGIYFPDHFAVIIMFGILWELFEFLTSNSGIDIPILSWFRGISKCNALSEENRDGHWMYAKMSDIFVNIFGFCVGRVLSQSRLIKNIIKKNNITPVNLSVSLTILFACVVYLYNLNVV